MNHDYCHCLDYEKTCPTACFRARLAKDLERPEVKNQLQYIPLSYSHLKGTKMRKRRSE